MVHLTLRFFSFSGSARIFPKSFRIMSMETLKTASVIIEEAGDERSPESSETEFYNSKKTDWSKEEDEEDYQINSFLNSNGRSRWPPRGRWPRKKMRFLFRPQIYVRFRVYGMQGGEANREF